MKKIILLIICVFAVQSSLAQEKKLTVLYTNDLHSHFEPQIVPWAYKNTKN